MAIFSNFFGQFFQIFVFKKTYCWLSDSFFFYWIHSKHCKS